MIRVPVILTALFATVFLMAFVKITSAQETPAATPAIAEQQLENLTENNDDAETEDDSYLQDMQRFIKNPVNLNDAEERDLSELRIISALQIQNLISYRNLLGKLIDIYELQAVPGWNVSLIKRIRPYVTVSNKIEAAVTLRERLKNGENTFLVRVNQVLEKSRGYKSDSSATNFYLGSPQKLFVRYKYLYKNLLQCGITGEKDAGEQFFKGQQKAGFDFYSVHFFARDIGVIKTIALGDFTVNLGQGLTQWMGMAFKKSADVLNIKRQSAVLRPYNSSGEIYFHRGGGITLKKKFIEATAFISYRRLDANFVADSLLYNDHVSSLQTTGYHRTKSEIDDKNIQGQLSFGGNMSYSKSQFHIGFNAVHYNFQFPVIKAAELYNKYSLGGRSWANYSIDYSYTHKNIHLFGEAASDKNLNTALINGLLISMGAKVDMSLLYRRISKGYQSLYTNAFTENTYPTNENGFYAGISINPNDKFKIDGYADVYNFPWLKYRTDAPSSGSDYLIQVTYKEDKQIEMYSVYKFQSKAINYNPAGLPLNPAIPQPRQNWRTALSYKVNSSFTLRWRVELLWYDTHGPKKESGFLTYADVLFKSIAKPLALSARLQYFETDGYNSRLYAYENDVLYSFSIPVFYDKGYRASLNINYDFSRKLSFWLRFAQSIYPGKNLIGSGADDIAGNSRTEVKCQAIYRF